MHKKDFIQSIEDRWMVSQMLQKWTKNENMGHLLVISFFLPASNAAGG